MEARIRSIYAKSIFVGSPFFESVVERIIAESLIEEHEWNKGIRYKP